MTRLPLTQNTIAILVDRFYEAVRANTEIGPVFNAAVENWSEHKQLLSSFWCSVALGTGTYRGFPMAVHRQHPLKATHFDQWLTLWRTTCTDVLEDSAAARMIEYAERIGRSLRYGLGLCGRVGARPLGIPIVNG
jgi:hemoglobin